MSSGWEEGELDFKLIFEEEQQHQDSTGLSFIINNNNNNNESLTFSLFMIIITLNDLNTFFQSIYKLTIKP